MKRILSISICLIAVFFFPCCKEIGRIDHIDGSTPAPAAPSVKEVISKPGGAVIKYTVPKDINLLGVMVTYMRNGVECQSKASKYTDSLVVEGFGNTEPQNVTLYSVGVNQKLSSGVDLVINPLTPPVQSILFDIDETFGGVVVALRNNVSSAELSVVVMADMELSDSTKHASEIDWTDLHTFHTSSKEISLYRRGLEARKGLYGVYLRDRYNNYSDTVYRVLTPVEEFELPSSTFRNAHLPTDCNDWAEGREDYGMPSLWDGTVSKFMATAHQSPIPQWFTIDLGYKASISRFTKRPRPAHELYSSTAPRTFELWGSLDPNPDGSWDDSWHLLGKFEQFKPSGYGEGSNVGPITDEDNDYWYNKTEFALLPTEEVPDPYQTVSYLRIKTTSTFQTYGTESTQSQVIIAELTFFGQVKE